MHGSRALLLATSLALSLAVDARAQPEEDADLFEEAPPLHDEGEESARLAALRGAEDELFRPPASASARDAAVPVAGMPPGLSSATPAEPSLPPAPRAD
ncbi:MAG: hypothetical protein AAGH15_26310, partial [Myxococcota bacterium]